MTTPGQIRAMLMQLLRQGAPVSRGQLLRHVARSVDLPPKKRALRGQVSGEIRKMQAEGLLVDGGPEVWLSEAAREDSESGED